MAKLEDMYVTLRVDDQVTPQLNRIRRRLWWHENGDRLMVIVTIALAVSAYVLGRLT